MYDSRCIFWINQNDIMNVKSFKNKLLAFGPFLYVVTAQAKKKFLSKGKRCLIVLGLNRSVESKNELSFAESALVLEIFLLLFFQ